MNKLIQILKLSLEVEQHVVDARQRTRVIARSLGFDNQDQVRLATAVSELARNAYQYAGNGVLTFSLDASARPQIFWVEVRDTGPGIAQLDSILNGEYVSKTGMGVGLSGARKLSDHFEIESEKTGTVITLGKDLPARSLVTGATLTKLSEELYRNRPESPLAEIQRQNVELLTTMEELNARQAELAELNQELADTNRGVVALYAELDEKASSLQKANEIKTGFLSNMTHEFRTPLTSILSLTRLLLDRLDGDLTEEQEKQVTFIRQSAEGLLELVNDLLDLAKVEAGKVALKIDEVEMTHLLGGIRGVFKPLLGADSEVELLIETESEVRTIYSDEGKIAQVLRNLVSNALKFTERGSVTVSVSEAGADYVLFTVRDTGIGIAPENIERIFEDFSQIESTLQSKARGTGLGLPLSRKLARLLGGDLWVESTMGQGSAFHVKIPRSYEGANEASLVETSLPKPSLHAAPAHPQVRKPHVFLVDDDEASRYVVKNLARMYIDSSFEEFSNGREAFERLVMPGSRKPELIMLDLGMPEMNGFDFLRAVKADESLSEIPVIVNTAKILSPDETDFLRQLSAGVLSKERSNDYRANVELRDALAKAELISENTPIAGGHR